jgi:hypothetical protein
MRGICAPLTTAWDALCADGSVRFTSPLCVTVLVITLALRSVAAQEPAVRRYQPNAADEDWSFLSTTPDSDRWDRLKYVGLGAADRFVTFSGEVRYRPEGFRVHGTETRPATIDNYLLQRYLAGADVHLGPHSRLFVEVQSGIINGALRSPRPTDRNRIDLHQGFYAWQLMQANRHRLAISVGRQELAVGSTRLISASPGLNV